MAHPHLVCVLEDSGDPVFMIKSFDHKIVRGDLIQHTVGGIATDYRVESVVLAVGTQTGDPEVTSSWTTLELRVGVGLAP